MDISNDNDDDNSNSFALDLSVKGSIRRDVATADSRKRSVSDESDESFESETGSELVPRKLRFDGTQTSSISESFEEVHRGQF